MASAGASSLRGGWRGSLLLISAGNFFRIGYQMVVLAWLSVQAGGSVAAPGQILLAASLASLLCAAWVGRLVDRVASKRSLLVLGQGAIGWWVAALLILDIEQAWGRQCLLVLVAVSTGVAANVAGGAADYYLKRDIVSSQRLRFMALLNAANQTALILGGMAGGAVLLALDHARALWAVVALAALLAIGGRCLLHDLRVPPQGFALSSTPVASSAGRPGPGWWTGLSLYREHPGLLQLALLSALVLSLAQVTNTLLPGLLKLARDGSSLDYALVELSWSAGALMVGMWLAQASGGAPAGLRLDLLLVASMLVLLAGVPFIASWPGLLSAHFLLGCGFSMVRVRNESRFLECCPLHFLGRFRANAMVINGVLGLAIYAIPSFAPAWDVSRFYVVLACTLLMMTVAVWHAGRDRHRLA